MNHMIAAWAARYHIHVSLIYLSLANLALLTLFSMLLIRRSDAAMVMYYGARLINVTFIISCMIKGHFAYHDLRRYVQRVFAFDIGHINGFPSGGFARLERSGQSDHTTRTYIARCRVIGRTIIGGVIIGMLPLFIGTDLILHSGIEKP